MVYTSGEKRITITPGMTHEEIVPFVPELYHKIRLGRGVPREKPPRWKVIRDRCFLRFRLLVPGMEIQPFPRFLGWMSPGDELVPLIQSLIHLPGLRGNPRRTYPKTAAGPNFPGTFDTYTASIVRQWQEKGRPELGDLGNSLADLGLSWKVSARAIDDTQVELRVGRLTHSKRGGAQDLVSIADVGFGVSQCLPVLVSLLVASPGQLVYLEQPEIHLHPKAQRRLAHLLCKAATRGVKLVVETHSALLIREVQTLVATKAMSKDDVVLHWFRRSDEGATVVTSADLDDSGAYGDWPEDFDSTELEAEQAYLDAVERRGTDE
jgi:hypothetical protein